ncbi:MAG: hypothetical protein ACRD7E_15275 [Bryobacteraceae bacterium]
MFVRTRRKPYTAMHRVTHMPVNAPLLYLDPSGQLSRATLDEMKRLKPDGVVQDGDWRGARGDADALSMANSP